MERFKEIVDVLAVAIPLLITVFAFIAQNSKNAKNRKIAENLNKITVEVNKYVQLAEGFVNYAGADKKEWVKTKVNQFAIENKIPYSEDIVSDLIEKIVAITKKVNARDKDKEVL